MRDELKEITEEDYWVYGLSEEDLDYTLRLADSLVEARRSEIQEEREQVKGEYSDPSIRAEIISDISHYAWIDEQYIWQFCLWRLQGILEGLILSEFLPSNDRFLPGLKAKLEAMGEAGYTLNSSYYEELLEWANLRNALSHAPPERYRPGPLRRSDVAEYKELIEDTCEMWRGE